MNILESKFDQAMLNKQNDFDIVLFDSGKEKLELYKRFIVDPEGSKIKFYF
jgi:hypothetical protein